MKVQYTAPLLGIYPLTCLSVTDLVVKGLCGDPGRPEKSQLSSHLSTYSEDESVTYECDQFISSKYQRKCVRGKWRGESAVCGKSYGDNDVIWAKIYDKVDGNLIEEYNISHLLPFTKFNSSFIPERYDRPLRAFGSKSYQFELTLQYRAVLHLVLLSLSVVDHLVNQTIKLSKFNIKRLTVSPYRICRHIRNSSVSPWFYNSTRFDYWYNCESIDDNAYEKELMNKTNMIAIETESNAVLDLDLAAFIVTQPYMKGDNPYQPICGDPGVAKNLEKHEIDHGIKYTFTCAQGFTDVNGANSALTAHSLTCATDMKWRGSLPQCMPDKTCHKFQLTEKQRQMTRIFKYEKVFFYDESIWFVIEGTEAYFQCKEETHIFVGKDVIICGRDGQWSDSLPYCLATDIVPESGLSLMWFSIIITLIVILTFVLSALLIYCVLRMKKSRSEKLNENNMRESNFYDDYNYEGLEAKTSDPQYLTIADEYVEIHVDDKSI